MLSIIIPSFNQSEYLPEAIESALKQEQCEVIVVDDGSTDNSLEIAKKYQADNMFRLKVISQVNKGLASARNTGIMNSFYKLILPLDADDILMDGAVKKILEVWQTTDADIIAPSFQEFGLSDRTVMFNGVPTLEDFKTANRIGYFSAIRKELLCAAGGYSPRMTYGYEDYHLWFDLLTRGAKLAVIPEILVKYRVKEKTMLKDAQAHHEELMAQIGKDFPLW